MELPNFIYRGCWRIRPFPFRGLHCIPIVPVGDPVRKDPVGSHTNPLAAHETAAPVFVEEVIGPVTLFIDGWRLADTAVTRRNLVLGLSGGD